MSDVRKRKGNVSKEKDVAKKIGSGRKESESSIKVILRYAVIVAVVAVCYHLSPYKLQLVPKDGMPIFSSSSSTPDVVAERKPVKVAEFIPVEFAPKTGEESKSYDLYKKARIVVPEDVYDSTHKVPWFEFDTKAYIDKGRISGKANAYKAGGFNQLVSDDVPMDRDIPDSRLGACQHTDYESDLPTTSIIITFHNELRSTLLRTITSVIRRTPQHILKEIVLVDDNSTDPSIGMGLISIEKVKLVVNRQREGLIRARIRAAMVATGDTLTFLDSHVEVNEKWIEPMMSKIKSNRKMVVAPIIDVINKDNFNYIGADAFLTGGVSWAMVFRWDWMTRRQMESMDHRVGLRSPTIAGGLFSIAKSWFHELGEYDDQMDIWGGENIEFSFRVWQCGGEMEILPCSRVGHVFRDDHPYDFGKKGSNHVFVKNNNRFVHTWMDEYKDFYYGTRPNAKGIPPGDLSIRHHFKKINQCKGFDWYIKNVYPRQHIPERNSVSWGHAKRGEHCLTTFAKKNTYGRLGASTCNQGLYNPNWQDMDKQSLVIKKDSNLFQQPVKMEDGSYKNMCFGSNDQPPKKGSLVVLSDCVEDGENDHQRWVYHGVNLKLQDYTELCMDATNLGSFKFQMCNSGDSQHFLFEMLNV